MGDKLKTKAAGFYLFALSAVIGIVSLARFLMWAPKHNTMDGIIVVALAAGIVLNVGILVKDNDYLSILITACYSVATVRVLTDSVGSFVDAFQGINMFGDASQVSTVISISAVMGVGILLSVVAAFMRREK